MKRIFLLLFLALNLLAQVNVYLHRPPPDMMEIENLWWVDITNFSQATYTAYLRMTVRETKKGIVFSGNSNTFTIPDGSTRITPKDIKDIINPFYNEEFRNYIGRTGKIPPGNYEICVQVYSVTSDKPIGENCININFLEPDAPRLIQPQNGKTIKDITITFNWSPVTPLPHGIQVYYTFIVVEVLKGQSPNEAIFSNKPIVKEMNLTLTSFTLIPSRGLLQEDKTFAWQVIAYDQNGIPVGKNNGKSQIYTFKTPRKKELPKIIKIGDFIVKNASYTNENLNSLSGSGETKIIQTILNPHFGGPPIIPQDVNFNVDFSSLKGEILNKDTLKIIEGSIFKEFSPPLKIHVYGYPVNVYSLLLTPDSALIDASLSPSFLKPDTGCGEIEFLLKQKVKPFIELSKDIPKNEIPKFVLTTLGIKIVSDAEMKIDLERTLTPEIYVKIVSGHTEYNPDMDTSNIGFLYGEYKFSDGIITQKGISLILKLKTPFFFTTLDPIGFKVYISEGEMKIVNSRFHSGIFKNNEIILPLVVNGIKSKTGEEVSVKYDSLVIDSTMNMFANVRNNKDIYWGGFSLCWEKGKFRILSSPLNPFYPVKDDTMSRMILTDTLPGLNVKFGVNDTFKIHSKDARNKIAIPLKLLEGWMNVGAQGITGEIRRLKERIPPMDVQLGMPGKTGYLSSSPFNTKLFASDETDTTTVLLFQFIGNASFYSDMDGKFLIPYPVGVKDSFTLYPFKNMNVTSTASFVGGLLSFKDTLILDYWGVGISSKRGIASVKTGTIVYTNADIYEPVHFSMGFNVIWGEMLADGNIGKFFFNHNSAYQKFDGFPITIDSASLSKYIPSKKGELVVTCGIYIKFFGEPDRKITIHDAKYNNTSKPYFGRYVTISPSEFKLKRDWYELADMNFDKVKYDELNQKGFKGSGNPDIKTFRNSPIYSSIVIDSSTIQVCMSSTSAHPVILPGAENSTVLSNIWGCATIVSDMLERLVIGGRVEATTGVLLTATAGGGVEAKMVLTPTKIIFASNGIMFIDITGVGNVELTGSVKLTSDILRQSTDGEIIGRLDLAALFSGLEADGQLDWHIEPLSHYIQGRGSIEIDNFGLGGGLAGGIYVGFNAPKSKAWVLMDGSSMNRRFGVNVDNLPDILTGVYGFGDLKEEIDVIVFSGGFELYVGLGAFLNVIGPDATTQFMIGLPLPYVVTVIGVYLHGEILEGLVSLGGWCELEMIPGIVPFAFQGTMGVEGCVLWVICFSEDITIGISSEKGFYIE